MTMRDSTTRELSACGHVHCPWQGTSTVHNPVKPFCADCKVKAPNGRRIAEVVRAA